VSRKLGRSRLAHIPEVLGKGRAIAEGPGVKGKAVSYDVIFGEEYLANRLIVKQGLETCVEHLAVCDCYNVVAGAELSIQCCRGMKLPMN
jgi:hypothetical protein